MLVQAKASSSEWHQKEREEEELILRRLERDVVDPRQTTPVTAGYEFYRVRDAVACVSPVFYGYSHTLCPTSQQRSATQQNSAFGGSGLQESAIRHPACQGYAMASDDDSTRVSPVFFFAGFAKVALASVVLTNDDDSMSESDLDGDGREGSGIVVLSPHEQEKLLALMDARFRATSDGDSSASTLCLVCKSTVTMGCPGCFTFSPGKHREVLTSQSTRRLKTPMTKRQEQEERQERHKALQRQLVMPSIYRNCPRGNVAVVSGAVSRHDDEFYANVLVDRHAIHKHRAVYAFPLLLIVVSAGALQSLTCSLASSAWVCSMNNFVTLHIKTLPVGSVRHSHSVDGMLSLQQAHPS